MTASRRPLITFYGDDLTGSTDVMEALAMHGVKTVLFARQPEAGEMQAFAGYDAIGLASASRSQPPAWMDRHLRPALAWLKSLDGELCHYKVCSTFNSSPEIGSIGRAIEIARDVFDQQAVPLVIGAPQLKRYTFAGHLFAAYQGNTFRIDRHPVMSRHPVTPMHESDVRVHLAAQMRTAADVRLIDVYDAVTQQAAGQELWNTRHDNRRFVVGSSGVEYALLQHLGSLGLLPAAPSFAAVNPVERMAVVSGSCSPTTERQLRHALSNGFEGIELDPVRADSSAAVDQAMLKLGQGRSVVIYTALGPATDRTGEMSPESRQSLGAALGLIMRSLIERAGLRRVVIAGGDTSGHALAQLPVTALTTRFPLKSTPGSPLCVSHSQSPHFNELEIAFKGGQVGGDAYFSDLRDGHLS